MTSTSYLPITIVPTKTFQEDKNTIYLSSSLLNYWALNINHQIEICIGSKNVTVTVDTKPIEKDRILFSELLLEEIPLPKKEILFLSQFNQEIKTLYIGPIFALVTEVSEQENEEPSFRSVHSFCEELHYASNIGGGFFYVFHLKDFSKDAIEGYYYETDGWKKDSFPPPNVIYNRVHSRKLEASSYFRKIAAELNFEKIPIFNERFLSKWEVHKTLYEEEHLHPYLPDTELYRDENLSTFLNKYNSVFIKPINGSQGRNILKVSRRDGKISVQSSTAGEQEKIMDFNQLSSFIEWFKKRRNQTTFIIQQSLPLAAYQNRQLDFRVLCHRNHQQDWKVTSIVSRVSAPAQFVSNLARGGEMLKPLKPLVYLFDQKTAISQVALMKELSIEAANVISQSSSGLIGELGIDMGVDESGRIWIIEINSKPSKNAEEQNTKIRPSAKAIFEYATSLAFQHIRKL
jgi:hypothetical protein